MAVSKKRVIKSLENLSEELKELLKEQYPNGYETSITRIVNAKKEPIFVFPLETEDAIYLVKAPATKNSDGGYDLDAEEKGEFGKDEDGAAAASDNFDNSGDGDDDYESGSGAGGGGDYDDDGDGKSGRESSYDPDFDN